MLHTLDVKGEVCPYSTVKTKKKMKDLAIGDQLKVIFDYPLTAEEIPAGRRRPATRLSRSRRPATRSGRFSSKRPWRRGGRTDRWLRNASFRSC